MDKRTEPRVQHNIRFFVHVQECKEAPELVGVSVECSAVDFSIHGMQFRTSTELVSNAMLSVTIGIGQPFAMYLLRGEIRWIRPAGDDFYLGVLLQREEGTDYSKWEEDFALIFPDE